MTKIYHWLIHDHYKWDASVTKWLSCITNENNSYNWHCTIILSRKEQIRSKKREKYCTSELLTINPAKPHCKLSQGWISKPLSAHSKTWDLILSHLTRKSISNHMIINPVKNTGHMPLGDLWLNARDWNILWRDNFLFFF